MITNKKCSNCHEWKPISEFYKRNHKVKNTVYAYTQSRCKVCNNRSVNDWRHRMREETRELK